MLISGQLYSTTASFARFAVGCGTLVATPLVLEGTLYCTATTLNHRCLFQKSGWLCFQLAYCLSRFGSRRSVHRLYVTSRTFSVLGYQCTALSVSTVNRLLITVHRTRYARPSVLLRRVFCLPFSGATSICIFDSRYRLVWTQSSVALP